MAQVDREALAEAYEDVRNDSSPTEWYVGLAPLSNLICIMLFSMIYFNQIHVVAV